MKHLTKMLILSTIFSLYACNTIQTDANKDGSKIIPDKLDPFKNLISKASTVFEEPVKPEKIAPNISSYYSNPAAALGGIFILKAKSGKTCENSNFDELMPDSLPNPPIPVGCRITTSSDMNLVSSKVKGGSSASLKYFVGDTGASKDYAFEFFVSRPYSAAFNNDTECVPSAAIKTMSLPSNTCQIRFIKAITLTQVTYRSYVNNSAKSSNAFTAISLDAGTYYNASDMITLPLLSVDTYTLEQFFSRNAQGFLQQDSMQFAKTLKQISVSEEDQKKVHIRKLLSTEVNSPTAAVYKDIGISTLKQLRDVSESSNIEK